MRRVDLCPFGTKMPMIKQVYLLNVPYHQRGKNIYKQSNKQQKLQCPLQNPTKTHRRHNSPSRMDHSHHIQLQRTQKQVFCLFFIRPGPPVKPSLQAPSKNAPPLSSYKYVWQTHYCEIKVFLVQNLTKKTTCDLKH